MTTVIDLVRELDTTEVCIHEILTNTGLGYAELYDDADGTLKESSVELVREALKHPTEPTRRKVTKVKARVTPTHPQGSTDQPSTVEVPKKAKDPVTPEDLEHLEHVKHLANVKRLADQKELERKEHLADPKHGEAPHHPEHYKAHTPK